ncbi:MAG: hypothetical protein NW200_12035 [Hyphomonadaceae bacterium]|nr:hypothetical protein [Hyphomonadaceae bacterium]
MPAVAELLDLPARRAAARQNLPRTALAVFATEGARAFACDVLRAAGVTDVTPACGPACERAADTGVDVIVTDWPARGDIGDHIDALRRDTNGARRDTPVVLLTSRDGRADIVAARAAGVNAYVVKPVSPAMLKHRLAKIATNAPGRLA